VSSFHRELNKADLHLHLEGSLEAATIMEMHPEISAAEVQQRYNTSDFPQFIESYKWVSQLLDSPGHYALATRHLLQRLAADNVGYVELTLSVGVILWKQQNVHAIFQAIHREAREAAIDCYWTFDFIRHFDLDHAMRVAELAVELSNEGVVGFGCGGDESRGPCTKYLAAFQMAQRAGLHLVPHAGETSDAGSVWDALRVGAERIGHGIRAVEDPELLAELRRQNIPLEICIASNVATGAVASLTCHPVRRIADAGVPIILNTDDPAMFRTSLSAEYEKAGQLGFTEKELQSLAQSSFSYGFGAAAKPH
jgi:aminodeoxyfutalosine deaminase